MEDKEHLGQPKKFENEKVEALLDQDPSQTQELTESLNVDQSTISKHESHWKPLEWFKSKEIGCRTSWSRRTSKSTKWPMNCCFKDTKKKVFYIVTGDEKWIRYDNPQKSQKIMVQTRRTINIEYSWHLAHPVLYLVGSIGCSVLWTAPIQRNHHWGTNINWCNEALKQKQITRKDTTTLGYMLRNRSRKR